MKTLRVLVWAVVAVVLLMSCGDTSPQQGVLCPGEHNDAGAPIEVGPVERARVRFVRPPNVRFDEAAVVSVAGGEAELLITGIESEHGAPAATTVTATCQHVKTPAALVLGGDDGLVWVYPSPALADAKVGFLRGKAEGGIEVVTSKPGGEMVTTTVAEIVTEPGWLPSPAGPLPESVAADWSASCAE